MRLWSSRINFSAHIVSFLNDRDNTHCIASSIFCCSNSSSSDRVAMVGMSRPSFSSSSNGVWPPIYSWFIPIKFSASHVLVLYLSFLYILLVYYSILYVILIPLIL